MHLASISSQEENDKLEKYIKDFGENAFNSIWLGGISAAFPIFFVVAIYRSTSCSVRKTESKFFLKKFEYTVK